jgi:hypothetical protein
MAGQRKIGLLSEEERKQMIERADYDRQTLSDNDLIIKRKLRAWLNEIKDVSLILRYLPEDLVRDELIDEYAFDLLSIAADIMRLQKFLSISGDMSNPEEWQARGYGIIRLAEDKDIGRSLILNGLIKYLVVFAGENYAEGQNPANAAGTLARLQDVSRPFEMIGPEEKKAIEKVRSAVSRYEELCHSAELKSGNG